MASTTSTLSQLMQTYYDRLFVDRVKDLLVHDQFSQSRPLKRNVGKSVVFSRYSQLARATTALTEGANPTDVNLSATNVSVTAQEYGNWTKISKLVALTAIDPDLKEKVSIMGQNGGETIDRLVREELFSGATVLLANGKGALSSIAASDTMNATDVRKAVRQLKKNKGLRFKDGFFAAIVGPDTSYDLMGDTAWLNAKTYSDVKALYRGEIGELHGARFVESTDQKNEASTVTVFSNFFAAMHAYGSVQLEGDEQKVYVKVPGPQSTDNPLDRFSTAGWAQSFASKVLVTDWIINLKTAASA